MSATGQRAVLAAIFTGALACLGWAGFGMSVAKTAVVRVGVNHSPPYAVIDAEGKPRGFSVEAIEAAAQRRGIAVEWVIAGEGPDVALATGKVDVWHIVTDIPSRRGHVLFTEPYLRTQFQLAVLKSSGIRTEADAAGRRISLANTPLSNPLARKLFPRARLVPQPLGKELVPLCTGQADAAFAGAIYLMGGLLTRPPACADAQFTLLPIADAGYNMAIGATPAGWSAARELRRGITDLSKDGTLERIQSAWLPHATNDTKVVTQLAQAKERSLLLYWSTALLAATIGVVLWLAHQQQKSRKAAQSSYEFVSGVLDHAGSLVIISDRRGQVVRFNRICERVTEKCADEVLGKSVWNVFVPEREQSRVQRAFEQLIAHPGQASEEHHWQTQDGERLFSWTNTVLLGRNGEAEYVIATGFDITDRALEERRLTYEAGHDALTGLLNRRRFMERLDAALAEAQTAGERLVILFADLDHFKEVNDTYGHAAGDKVLQFFSRLLLKEAVGAGAVAGRMGGDEFCVLTGEPASHVLAASVRRQMNEHEFLSSDDRKFQVSVTFGLAQWTLDMQYSEELLSAADGALYRAKRAGRNQIAIYEGAPPRETSRPVSEDCLC